MLKLQKNVKVAEKCCSYRKMLYLKENVIKATEKCCSYRKMLKRNKNVKAKEKC